MPNLTPKSQDYWSEMNLGSKNPLWNFSKDKFIEFLIGWVPTDHVSNVMNNMTEKPFSLQDNKKTDKTDNNQNAA